MQDHSTTPNAREESSRQWKTQPATGDVIGGCEVSSLGALLLAVRDGSEQVPSVYFAGVRADYIREGDHAVLRVVTTHGSPMTELVPACELQVAFPAQDLGAVRSFLEGSVRRMVPEVEFVKRQLKVQQAQVSAGEREVQSRNVWQEAGAKLHE